MVKKSIIVIALMSMLATVSFAQDTGQSPGEFKIDGSWPVTVTVKYNPVEICRIKVYLKVGMFIQLENCSNKSVNMVQVDCSEINQNGKFPCYKGCTDLRVRANFDAVLSLAKYKIGNIINGNNWKAYFRQNSSDTTKSDTWNIVGDGNPNDFQLCVEAWDANIYAGTPGQNVQVGEVAISAVPTATPHCGCNFFGQNCCY